LASSGLQGPYCSMQWLPASCSATRDGAVAPSHSSPGSVSSATYGILTKLNSITPLGFNQWVRAHSATGVSCPYRRARLCPSLPVSQLAWSASCLALLKMEIKPFLSLEAGSTIHMLPKHSQLLSVSTVEPCFSSRHIQTYKHRVKTHHTILPGVPYPIQKSSWNRFLGVGENTSNYCARTTAHHPPHRPLHCVLEIGWVADAPTPLPLGCSEKYTPV
jgi:hypothetical protein